MDFKGRENRNRAKGEGVASSKLRPDDVRMIRHLVANGTSQARAARNFNVTPQAVNYIVKEKTWRHIQDGNLHD
ncbi:MAG: hypothetical protein UY28_C0004G0008 [Candidatus Amesbacteria bacterium GW2011_GWB1_48_13]|uniref:HTH psq-type domain-containing protein n=1 Tax=Candidatus Amesbacteria bacterium GW2011_GWB1_48_13 TaxID=1618362 RepID=A0A0G1XVD7_9BACT|nr:MAG: hypothetical protein UY28_C0004G0008 [Candidatus Amesbacteria bacterium GW2011_GWB1_48_13]